MKRKILAIGKVLQRRSGETIEHVRQISEELAQLGEQQGHQNQFERPPDIVATHRGYYSGSNEIDCQQRKIRTVAIPISGKKSIHRQRHQRRPAFRRAQLESRWRSA